ncbi:protein-tyrosine-phosphatase [Rhodococcus rhodnii LMG 5362]|uniref:protein-tyrosine-phosphatase n=1 Tax=Rhodococcus rhodnii LMG 5362 TaxID=1273125 RepID=R7WPX7_9NOCA|nr:protein-tyrosine-phosphatase [Rhodococcus rhodnii LMG 5362]
MTFVCTGNICRSPMAELVLRRRLEDAGLSGVVRVSSAGTDGWHIGERADERAEEVLREHGYPTDHSAAQVGDEHTSADLVVALATSHDRHLAGLGVPTERRRLLRSFDPDADGDSVADPYYGDRADFEEVLRQIEAAAPGIVEWVREHAPDAP